MTLPSCRASARRHSGCDRRAFCTSSYATESSSRPWDSTRPLAALLHRIHVAMSRYCQQQSQQPVCANYSTQGPGTSSGTRPAGSLGIGLRGATKSPRSALITESDRSGTPETACTAALSAPGSWSARRQGDEGPAGAEARRLRGQIVTSPSNCRDGFVCNCHLTLEGMNLDTAEHFSSHVLAREYSKIE